MTSNLMIPVMVADVARHLLENGLEAGSGPCATNAPMQEKGGEH